MGFQGVSFLNQIFPLMAYMMIVLGLILLATRGSMWSRLVWLFVAIGVWGTFYPHRIVLQWSYFSTHVWLFTLHLSCAYVGGPIRVIMNVDCQMFWGTLRIHYPENLFLVWNIWLPVPHEVSCNISGFIFLSYPYAVLWRLRWHCNNIIKKLSYAFSECHWEASGLIRIYAITHRRKLTVRTQEPPYRYGNPYS